MPVFNWKPQPHLMYYLELEGAMYATRGAYLAVDSVRYNGLPGRTCAPLEPQHEVYGSNQLLTD